MLDIAASALSLACLSCTDRHPTLPDAETGRVELTALVECSVDVGAGTLSCTEAPVRGADGVSLALLGNNQVRLRSASNAYDTLSLVYGFDVTVQNLLGYTIGTPDGQTRTGIKAFFETGPYVTAYKSPGDTGTVAVTNADGVQNFTAAAQPYFVYDTLLAYQETTTPRRWEMRVPRTVDRFGFTVRVFTTTPVEQRVPMIAPSSEPAWFGDPAYWIRFGNSQTMILKNVVEVNFRPGATQEERQSAVDMVKGSVVGGGAGLYYVRVPANGTVASLLSYITSLERLPQVSHATIYIVSGGVGEAYLKPYDAVQWRAWQLNPDSADGQNWGLERIAAPFAWGCNWGDTASTVAVLDQGFHAQPDLARNVDLSRSIGWNAYSGSADTIDHGTRVAAILSARGNDSSQVTGAMWQSRLRLYDISIDTTGAPLGGMRFRTMWSHFRRAGFQGARVINLSLGIPWRDTLGHFRNPATETDSAQRQVDSMTVATWRRHLELSLDSLVAAGHDPLVVAAAGNNAIDARWSGFATTTHANRVLRVGASNLNNGLAAFSNRGPLVEITAPGQGLHVLWGNGSIDSVRTFPSGTQSGGDGTSFAAPFVAGVAGLLFGFDARLTAPEVKQLIVAGAVRANRSAGGIPLLNAHESLKLAAERVGAPLCGNRLWFEGGYLRVQRAGQNEPIIPQPTSTTSAAVPLHGGRKIRVRASEGVRTYVYQNGVWAQQSALEQLYAPGVSGAAYSAISRSHNGDSIAEIRIGSGSTFIAGIKTLNGVFHPLNSVVRAGTAVADTLCVAERIHPEWGNSCLHRLPSYERQSAYDFSVTHSPLGDEMLFSLQLGSTIRDVLEWFPCNSRLPPGTTIVGNPVEPYDRCRDLRFTSSSGGSEIFGVRIRDGQLRAIPALNSPRIAALAGVSEDGREVAIRDVASSSWRVEGWVPDTLTSADGTVRVVALYNRLDSGGGVTCTLRYRNLQSGAATFSAPCSDPNDPRFTPFSADRAPVPR